MIQLLKNFRSKDGLTAMAIAAAILLAPEVVHAAANSDEWVKPATGLIDALRSGLMQIGAVVIGLVIIGRGIYIASTGNPDIGKLAMVIFGGVLIMAGPKSMALLLEIAQAS
ncbi:MAG: hypothetical protein HON65_10015 [Rhodospirillales bacterium]|jgi:type IV secretory pathway VirB2 component (pilin)|nr:hypothetical protein [Rhodospirillales bacterium]